MRWLGLRKIMKLPDTITELKTWPNGSLVVFLERLKHAVSTYQEDDMIEEVIERLKRQDKQVKALERIRDMPVSERVFSTVLGIVGEALGPNNVVSGADTSEPRTQRGARPRSL
jgi:hypothetical protein